ncbi:hypothetical protein V6257_18195 [Pseudoalteromonas issachenkonii]|uniref:Uncharacterized protein n=1 Tax=Pseudoalteromonas issachenkonii TaxID=152297 RepID=A0ABU9H510_9GAMM
MNILFAAKQLKPAPRAIHVRENQHDKSPSKLSHLSPMAVQHNVFESISSQEQTLECVVVLSNN